MIWASLPLFLISLLAVLKAPAKPLWFVAIAATEWGHYLAIGSALVALLCWRLERRWTVSSGMALAAVLLFLSPLLRAFFTAQRLPEDLVSHFGSVLPREGFKAPARTSPLRVGALFTGIFSPDVQISNVVYATVNGQPLTMDLYRPEKIDQSLPGVIVVHSGSWQSGDRSEFSDLDRYLAARGYLVASIDYRLAPGATFPAQRDDVFAAISYLEDHAKEIGWDKDLLVLLGRSAGGQIALSAAYAEKIPAIKGVIAISAPSDLSWAYSVPANPLIMNSQKVIETYLGGTPSQLPGAYEAASPLHFVNKNTPPTLMIHGVRDELVWAVHEDRLSKRLAEAGVMHFYLRLPWATHGCDANFSGPSGQISTYAIERFLAFVMPSAHEESLARERSPHVRQNTPA